MNSSNLPTDHDLLIRIDERVGALMVWVKNHDLSHKRTVKVLSGIAAGVGSLVAFITNLFLRR